MKLCMNIKINLLDYQLTYLTDQNLCKFNKFMLMITIYKEEVGILKIIKKLVMINNVCLS